MRDSLTASQLLLGLLDLIEEMQPLNQSVDVDGLRQVRNDLLNLALLHGNDLLEKHNSCRPNIPATAGGVDQISMNQHSSRDSQKDGHITAGAHNPRSRIGLSGLYSEANEGLNPERVSLNFGETKSDFGV